MIIVRTPLRVSLFGGGTDIPSYYSRKNGMVISMAINKHVYITAHPMFESNEILLKYSKMERVSRIEDIKHNIFRILLGRYNVSGVDLGVSSDIPSGTGLGSSSSFTVGLSNLLGSYTHRFLDKETLAREACEIEISALNQNIGKQDQYAAAFGGINRIEFCKDHTVRVNPIEVSIQELQLLTKSLFLVRVGKSRDASSILNSKIISSEEQLSREKSLDDLIRLTKSIDDETLCNPKILGELLTESWNYKKSAFPNSTNLLIDELIQYGLRKGASGAKLLGAGGSGFVLFVVPLEWQKLFIESFINYKVITFDIDFDGSSIIYDNRLGR